MRGVEKSSSRTTFLDALLGPMSKTTKTSLVLAATTAVFVLVGALTFWPSAAAPRTAPAKHVSALFIGNSYSSANDLPRVVSQIADASGHRLDYDLAAVGGYRLKQHAADPRTIAKISAKPWDFVVLQEQSQVPAISSSAEKEKFLTPFAKQLQSMIRQANPAARTVLFETWGKENGDRDFCPRIPEVCDYPGDQARITATYRQLAVDLPAEIAPVGEAWAEVRQTHPEIELYQSDGSHPSMLGTYLAACVFYAVFFGGRATDVGSLALDPAQAKIIREIVDRALAKS
jgi:hypothetical protein